MDIKKLFAGLLSANFLVGSTLYDLPFKIDNGITVSAITDTDSADPTPQPITLEDVKATQAFLLTADYVGPGNVLNVNADENINLVDFCLAKQQLIESGVPSLVNFKADVCDIYINLDIDVTFTLEVTAITPLEKDAVSIYDDSGAFVAVMHDDGNNGDEIADDGIYTAVTTLSSDEICTVDYYAATDEVKSNSYEICFYRDLEEEEFRNFWFLYDDISKLPFNEACQYIETSDEILTYTIDENNRLITYQSIYGIHGCWEEFDESSGFNKGNGIYAVPEANGIDYSAVEDTISSTIIQPNALSKNDVIVLRPFRNSDFQYDDFQIAGNLLANALDSNLTVVDDENVTLDQMKNLASYGTVLIDSHGMLKNEKTPYMLIGENLDEIAFLWDPIYYLAHVGYSADYLSGRICCTSSVHDGKVFNRMAVGEKFFEKYYSDNSLEDSFWFLGTCYSLYDNSIADALTGKGAEAVVGFTNVVSVRYCNATLFETVLNSLLLSADTIGNSIAEAKEIYGANDPTNDNTRLKMRGKVNYKLINDIVNESFPQIIKTYSGTYVASQGLTSLDFTIFSCDERGIIDALFSFYENPANIGVPSGSYRMRGKIINISRNSITVDFEGTEWMDKPSTYHILNFTANIDLINNTLTSDDYDINLVNSYTFDISDIAKEYSGSYQNNEGLMGLDFSITSCTSDGKATALFSFHPHPDNPGTPSGSYTMVGSITNIASNGTVTIQFTGDEWIDKPDSYIFANFTATINKDRSQLKSDDYHIDLVSS